MSDPVQAIRLWVVKHYTLHTFVQMKGVSYGQAKADLRRLGIGWKNDTGELFIPRKK